MGNFLTRERGRERERIVTYLTTLSIVNLLRTYWRGLQIFQKYRSHLKMLGARMVTGSKSRTEERQFWSDRLTSPLSGAFCSVHVNQYIYIYIYILCIYGGGDSSDCVENIWSHGTEFSRPCNQAPGVCAPLISSLLPVAKKSSSLLSSHYEGWSKIFRTDAVKIIKLSIRPIGRRHPRSSSLPHVDTGPTVSFIFGTLPWSPFLSECQALSAFRPGSPQWYRTGVLSASFSF